MIPVVLAVDVEPDGPGEAVPPSGPWAGFAATQRYLNGLRGRIEDLTGRPAVFTWFLRMDPQVARTSGSALHAVRAHPDVIADLVGRGDPLGLHIHAWRPTADGAWVDDYQDRAWLDECIGTSHAAFLEAVGVPCRLVRMGQRFLDDWTVDRLATCGDVVDLTLEPANHRVPSGARPHILGELPDTRRVPRAPHRLAPGLMELPLSASSRPKGWHPRRHASRIRHHGLWERLDLPVQLARVIDPPDRFGALVERTLRGQRRPYLAYALRSDGLVDPVKRRRIAAQMEELLALLGPGTAFLGPEEALAALGPPRRAFS